MSVVWGFQTKETDVSNFIPKHCLARPTFILHVMGYWTGGDDDLCFWNNHAAVVKVTWVISASDHNLIGMPQK